MNLPRKDNLKVEEKMGKFKEVLNRSVGDASQKGLAILMDFFKEEEVLKGIPVLKHVVAGLQIKDAYKAYKARENFRAFTKAIEDMNEPEEQKFIQTLNEGTCLSNDTAEAIFDVIMEGERPLKAEILGNLSVALAREQISLDDYNTVALIIYSGSVAALRALEDFIKTRGGAGHVTVEAHQGLLNSLGVVHYANNRFVLNDYGRIIVRQGFRLDITSKPS